MLWLECGSPQVATQCCDTTEFTAENRSAFISTTMGEECLRRMTSTTTASREFRSGERETEREREREREGGGWEER